MRKLKLFFACLLMAVLSIGQVWATGPITINFGTTTGYWAAHSADGTNDTYTDTDSRVWTRTCAVSNRSGQAGYSQFGNASNACTSLEFSAPAGSDITVSAFSVTMTGASGGATPTTGTIYLYKRPTAGDDVQLATASVSGNTAVQCAITADASFSSTDKLVVAYVGTVKAIRVNSLSYTYTAAGGTSTCATPTFNPAAGAVVSGTAVTLSTNTEGASIYYTMGENPADPTTSSTQYNQENKPVISSATTIKAIAVKAGLDNSSVATAAYTVLTPLTTMDQIFAAATSAGTTATDVAITFNNWVVTGVKNKNAYVTDGTKGFIVFQQDHGFNVGDVLSGSTVCKVQLYNGSAELTELTASKVTVTTGGSVSPVVLGAEGIAALTGVNTGSVIKINGACTYENNKYYIAGVQLYNTLYSFSVSAGTNYECTGVYLQYNSTKEMLPRSAADIVAQTSVANPTFSPAAGEYTEVQNVTLSCATDGATVYYTTDGTNPTNESTAYSSAIEVGATMTIKAIAYKGDDHSEVVSAAYTINLPLPSHDFQVTHKFSTEEGFEFPTGWGGSYAEHEIAYTDDKVHFVSASHQSGTITDRPVVKEGAISLILTNSHKLISAARFDYIQWSTKVPTLTMKYSTDGGETYNNFDPVVSSTDFAVQVLDMPEGVNAIQVVGTADKQVGLTSIAFDLEDKPIVTKTVTITAPTNGTLVVMNGEDAISSGDNVEVGTILTIEATPAEGYKLTEVTVNGSAYAEATLELTENVTIAASFEENLAPLVETFVLSEIGVETSHLNGERVGDKVNLPLTAASCSKVFRGWDADPDCATAPTYAPGAEYTLALNNKLYAVYADAGDAAWSIATSVKAGDVVVISTNTGYTANDMKTAGAISSSLFSCLASTYNADNSQITALAEGTLQFTVGGNATDGWTLMNGTKYLKVTAAKKVNLVDDEETWNISFSGNNATLAPATGDLTAYSIQYNYNTGNDRFTAYNTNQVAISLYKQVASYENYSTDCEAQVATPTFSPVAGTYTTVQNVTIACETEDVTIYYTTNGDDPTTSSTEYTAAIPVNESMTIKAIAVKSGMANSAIASAAYTINLPLSTMDQIFAAATAAGSTATDVNIAFGNWVVSGVSTNGKNVFVTDGTKGFIIYDGGGEMGFAVGNVLSGTVACKVQLYNGAAELTTLSSTTEGLNIATGGVITPAAKAISELGGINTGAPVIINSVQFYGEYLTDGANSIKPYNSLYADAAFTENTYYNVTGIYQQFGNTTKEILPRSAADIEEVSLSDPEISYTPASATIELGQSLPGTVFANPHELAISYSSNNEAVATVTDAGVISLAGGLGTAVITASFAGNATYAAANVTYTITVNPASVSENVVILAVYNEKYYAMSTTNANNGFTAIEVEYNGTQVTVNSAEDKAAIQWTKTTNGDNTTFQDADSKYMKSADGASMSLNANVCNWVWDATGGYYKISGTSRTFFFQNASGGIFKNYATSNLDGNGYSGKAQVIVIAEEDIVITAKVSAELAYDPAEVELTVGDDFTPATLTYADGFDGLATVTYESSNPDLATVEGGVVSLVVDAIGTATITATFAGNNNYLAGSASYTITVNAPAPVPTTTTYRKVTATEEITDGEYLIVYETTSVAFNGALETLDAEGNIVAVVINEGVIAGTTAIDAAVFTIDVTAGTLQSASGKYIGVSSNSNGLKQTEDASTYTHTFSIDGDGNAVIFANFENSTMKLRYNPSTNAGNLRFRYYKNDGQQAIQLYKKETPEPPTPQYETVRDGLTEGWYYTMCLDKAVTAVQGGTIWRVLSKADNGTDVILEEVTGTLDAGRPYIFRAAASTLEVAYTGAAVGAPVNDAENNGLVGSFSKQLIDQSETNYIIYDNALYYVNSVAYVGAHRAYLDMTGVPAYNSNNEPQQGNAPRRRVVMAVNGQNGATGFENINATEKPMKLMIDGKIYILRGEKMYDATGRLVK